MEVHEALEANGEAEVSARGKEHDASAGQCGSIDGAIDGGRVNGLAVAGGAVVAHVKNAERRGRRGTGLRRGVLDSGESCCCGAEAAGAKKAAPERVERIHGCILIMSGFENLIESNVSGRGSMRPSRRSDGWSPVTRHKEV